MRVRPLVPLALSVLLAACGGDPAPPTASNGGGGSTAPLQATAQVASSDHYVEAPQRVQLGIVVTDPDAGTTLLTAGTIEVQLTPAQGGDGTPVAGEATYVPAPGTQGTSGDAPALTTPDVGRGVYQLDATFDAPGVWEAVVAAEVGGNPLEATARFEVLAEPRLPAPGQPALPTENLTADDDDPEAVDSRAIDGAPIPDPELHAATIRDALRAGRPIVALFSTPIYCQSQFCGPSTDALAEIAATGPADAAYIHVEIWHDFDASEVNAGAADWLLRDGDLTEPWLYLIDGNGMIVDRWSPLFDPAEVDAELDRL
jgi:hypothetical protein